MTQNFQCPINLQFNCDWDRIHKIFNRLVEKKNQGYFSNCVYEPAYKANIYSIGTFGSLITSTSLTGEDNEWRLWNGKFLEWTLPPEIFLLTDKLVDAGLNFVNFSYTCHYGEIKKHTDGKRINEGSGGHCNLNYIISSTDPQAKTISTGPNGETELYLSSPGKVFLLDTATPHQIISNGIREVFQLKFHSSFDEVKRFFANNNLILK
jgi:hypothetical protein